MTSRTRVYIAGSISNNGTLPHEEVVKRLEGFTVAETQLRAYGYDPINPARRGKVEGKSWLDYMRDSLRDIADSDGIALLPGWEESRGAQIERELGSDLGIPTYSLDAWLGRALMVEAVRSDIKYGDLSMGRLIEMAVRSEADERSEA
jgi:hypothetical protein